jgi:hypothetical protein
MPSRERRLREVKKQQQAAGVGDEPENVTQRKKKSSSKKSESADELQTKQPDATDSDEQHSNSTPEVEGVDNADHNGQQYLGEEFVPKKNKKIEKLALDYQQKRDARMAQTKLEVAARKLLQDALHTHIDELLTDEEGRKIYKFPGKKTKVILDTTEKVYVKDVEDEEDEEVY